MTGNPLVCSFADVERSVVGKAWLGVLEGDIARLSPQAVELVAGLVSVQHSLPENLVDWLLSALSRYADLRQISPAAEAAMQIGLASNYLHWDKKRLENEREFALLCALQKERYLDEAIKFLRLLAQRVAIFLVFCESASS